jgi:hypothetical protein
VKPLRPRVSCGVEEEDGATHDGGSNGVCRVGVDSHVRYRVPSVEAGPGAKYAKASRLRYVIQTVFGWTDSRCGANWAPI